jgi:hypothetical protein
MSAPVNGSPPPEEVDSAAVLAVAPDPADPDPPEEPDEEPAPDPDDPDPPDDFVIGGSVPDPLPPPVWLPPPPPVWLPPPPPVWIVVDVVVDVVGGGQLG